MGLRSAPRVFVFLQHGLSLEAWRDRRDPERSTNTESPYGYAAAMHVTEMSWSKDACERHIVRVVRRALRRMLGFDLLHAWHNRRALTSTEVVWTHTERESLAALMVLRLLRAKARVIAQSVWLWDEWPRRSWLMRRFHLSLLKGAAVEVTLSEANKARARQIRHTENVYCVPFGAGVNEALAEQILAEPRASSEFYVLAVGSDRHRDWATLHEAARALSGVRFRVATLDSAYPKDGAPSNVDVSSARTLEECYRLYAGAALVILPLTPNLHASGCTVALEAQRFGKPLVTTDVGGLSLYLGDRGVYLYNACDPESLTRTIAVALDDQRSGRYGAETDREFLASKGLTAEDYAARFFLLTRWLLERDPRPEDIELPVPVRSILSRTATSDHPTQPYRTSSPSGADC